MKTWGLKFQVAAEPILGQMGYRIIRAQHRPLTALGRLGSKLNRYRKRTGDYLWNYGDYIIDQRRHLYVVEVKSQGYVPSPGDGEKEPFTWSGISFTPRQKEQYQITKVPILVLLIFYKWGGKFEKYRSDRLPLSLRFEYDANSMRGNLGIKGSWTYSEKPDEWELGPVLYKVVPFSDFQFQKRDHRQVTSQRNSKDASDSLQGRLTTSCGGQTPST